MAQPHIAAVTDQVTQASHRAALHHVVARRQIEEHHRRAPIEARRHRAAATHLHHRRVVAHIAVVAAALHTVEAQHRHVDKQIFGTLKSQEYETDIQTISSGAHRHNDTT